MFSGKIYENKYDSLPRIFMETLKLCFSISLSAPFVCISILCNQSIAHKHNSILLHQHEILKKSYTVKLYKTEIPIFFTSHCCNQYCRLNWWLIKRKTMHACICIFKFLSTSILLASNECIAIIGLQNNDKHTLWIKKWSCLIILAKEIPHFILDLT